MDTRVGSELLYEKPAIRRLQIGAMSKFALSPAGYRTVRESIDGVAVDELVHRFGSPLFVFSETTIRRTLRDAKEIFLRRYPKVEFAWSYKTNYLNAIAAVFHQEGSLAEVVSGMEYDKARALGVPGDRILFNGPRKTPCALRRAAEEGARIHIDHFDEIDDLEVVAREMGKTVKVALRLNLDAGIQPQWNRFGFNLESGQALDAARRIRAGGVLRIHGLHCHVGTFILDPAAYRTQVEKLIGFGYRIEKEFGFDFDYLDLGGGLPSQSRLKGSFMPPEISVPALQRYADAIGDGLESSLRPGHFPTVIIESGRALIDEAGFLISTTHAAKRMPDGRRAYVLDAGINLLYTSTWYRFPLELDRDVPGMPEPSILNGPLCMNIDVVDEGVMLPPLSRGVRLIFSMVGAYNVTQWMQFIEYRPAVVMVTEGGRAEVIRQREDLSDLTHRERMPSHLSVIDPRADAA